MKKILIISSSYPYGKHETFLETEINFLSKYFEINVLPIYKLNKNDIPRKTQNNVTYSLPLLDSNILIRIIKGLFNRAPLLSILSELVKLFKETKNKKASLIKLFSDFILIRSLLSLSNFKIALENSDYSFIYFYWGIAPAKFLNTNKSIFIRVHGGEIYKKRNFGFIPFSDIKFVYKPNIKYLSVSDLSNSHLKSYDEKINSKVNRLGVFDNGLNPYVRKEILTIVSCSTLIPVKRVNLIIECLKKINKQKINWVHFGDGPEFENILNFSKTLKDNIAVEFKGRVSNKEVINYYKNNSVDFFVNVSESEGIPVSIMEALSFGIPCFATDAGANREIICNDVGALVSKHFNPIEFQLFIDEISKSEIMSEKRKKARKRWDKLFNAKTNYKELIRLFDS